MLKNFLLGIIASLIFLSLLESVVRVLVPDTYTDPYWRISAVGFGDLHPDLDFIETQRSNGLPFRVQTNSQGLRNDELIQLPKPQGLVRILAVGDSFTFGFGVNNHDTWSHFLSEKLAESLAPAKVEVINAGFPGYTIKDEYEYLLDKGLDLNPDLVVLQAFQNDLTDFSPSSISEFSRSQKLTRLHRLGFLVWLEKSRAFNWGNHFWSQLKHSRLQTESDTNKPVSSDKLELPAYEQAYFNYLSKTASLLADKKVPWLIVYFPNHRQLSQPSLDKLESSLSTISPETGYNFLDLKPTFEPISPRQALFLLPADGHLSRFGNIIAATAISPEIVRLLSTSNQTLHP